jgi:hypothetical protein
MLPFEAATNTKSPAPSNEDAGLSYS